MRGPRSALQKPILCCIVAGAVSRQRRQRRGCIIAQRAAVEADIALTKLHLEMRPFARRLMAGSFPSKPPSGSCIYDAPYFYPNRYSSLVRDPNFRETDLKNIRSGTPATIR